MSVPNPHTKCIQLQQSCVPWTWACLDALRARSQRTIQRHEAILFHATTHLEELKELSRRVEETLRKKSECLAAELEAVGARTWVARPSTDRLETR